MKRRKNRRRRGASRGMYIQNTSHIFPNWKDIRNSHIPQNWDDIRSTADIPELSEIAGDDES